jgi:large subunit ribosomal protein L23
MTISKPITTEKVIKILELDNTLVFEVDTRKNKDEIKQEFEKMFNVKVEKIRTLKRKNKKIAYLRLNKKNPAIDIATKLGMM